MRALAVIAVMVYHANNAWLPGGFIGVEVFFVISGYLITLLLIGEHERSGKVRLGKFYLRRARRLLPALFMMLTLVIVYTALFKRAELGRLRGDVLAGLGYVSNWFQIWVGQGYTAEGQFAPLRHLWSLAVEEQFYLVWPLRDDRPDPRRQGPAAVVQPLAAPRRGGDQRRRRAAVRFQPRRRSGDDPERLLGHRRTRHRQDRHPVPLDDQPRLGAARRCGAGDAVATGSGDAWAAAQQGCCPRRARPRRLRLAARAGVAVAHRLRIARRIHRCSAAASSPSTWRRC